MIETVLALAGMLVGLGTALALIYVVARLVSTAFFVSKYEQERKHHG